MNENLTNPSENGYSIADLLDMQAHNIAADRSKAAGTQIGQSFDKIDLNILKKSMDTSSLVNKARVVDDTLARSDKTRVKTIDIPADFDPLTADEKTRVNSLEYSTTYIDVDGIKSGGGNLEILNPNNPLRNKDDSVIIYDDADITVHKSSTDNNSGYSLGAGIKRKVGIAKSSVTVNHQTVGNIIDIIPGIEIDTILEERTSEAGGNNVDRPVDSSNGMQATDSVSKEEVESLFDTGTVIPEIDVPIFDSSEFDSEFDELTASIASALSEVENIRTRIAGM